MSTYIQRRCLRWLLLVGLGLSLQVLSGCEIIVLHEDGLATRRAQINTIGLIAGPEPEYENLPRPLPASTRELLDELGGPLGTGVYIARDLIKTHEGERELKQALRPFNPQVAGTLAERLQQNLSKLGYTVKYVPQPARIERSARYDVSPREYQGIDAFIDLSMSVGYAPDPRQDFHFPFFIVAETVFDKAGVPFYVRDVSFLDPLAVSDPQQLAVPGKYALRDQQAVIDNPGLVIEALYEGAGQLADLLAQDF